MAAHTPTLCILDTDKTRCLREEQALDLAIKAKGVSVHGISNYGENYLARTGISVFPSIEFEGMYFTPKHHGEELTYEMLCDFIEMLVRRGILLSAGR